MEGIFDKNLDQMSDEEKRNLLLYSIPFLDKYKKKAGHEGEVFFVSPDLIIKKYFGKLHDYYTLSYIFDAYCKECIEFNRKGYNIPKIHSWTMVGSNVDDGFDYYLLEERVPGRELFISTIDNLYGNFKDFVEPQAFKDILANPAKDIGLYEEVVRRYMHDFITMNERIESMSEKDLETFLESIYNMFVEGYYAIPDVHARNVLIDQQKLKLIDLYLEKEDDMATMFKGFRPDNLLFSRIVALFDYNGDMKQRRSNESRLKFTNELVENNEVLCTAAIEKIVKVAKKRLCSSVSGDREWYKKLVDRLGKILEKENRDKILNLMDVNVQEKQ